MKYDSMRKHCHHKSYPIRLNHFQTLSLDGNPHQMRTGVNKSVPIDLWGRERDILDIIIKSVNK